MAAPSDIAPLATELQLPPISKDSGSLLEAGEDERLQRLADELRRQLMDEEFHQGGC